MRAGVAAAQHLEQVLIVDDTPASSSSHDANAARRQPGPQSSMEDLIAWEEDSVGCSDGGRCACALLWKKGTHFVRILFTKLPLILPAGHRPSAICAPVRQRVSELPPRDLATLPIACAVDQTPVGPRSDACTLTLPTCDPGPGPGPILTSAQLRQRGMHLSADEKKRKAEAHGYSTMLATRGCTSLLKAIFGPAVDVDNPATLHNFVWSSSICCKRGCPNRDGPYSHACVATTGGYEHLVSAHIEHLGTEEDTKPREKKHKNVSGGSVKNRGPVASRRQRLQELLDDAVWCEQVDPNGKDHVYGYNFTLPHSSGSRRNSPDPPQPQGM